MNAIFMEQALEQALLAKNMGEVPIGAVIVKNNKVIAAAHNLCEKNKDATAHAELLAIQKACKTMGDFRLNGCTLYVTLEPCPMCAGAAANARIDEIVFGAYDPVKGATDSVINIFSYNFPNKPTVYGGIRESECAELLTDFFKNKRK